MSVLADDGPPGRLSVDEIHAQVRDRILDGRLAPDVPLSQVQLARELGVGRTPLREALRMLQREGLVEGEYNKRVHVVGLSISDLDQLYALRIVQESIAVRVAVPLMSDADLGDLDTLLARMSELQGSEFAPWEIVHTEFHARLVERAGVRFAASLRDLNDHARRYRRALLEAAPISYDIGAKEHAAIIAACRDRDTIRAGGRLATHLARTALSLLSLLRPGFEPVAIREAYRVVVGDAEPMVPFADWSPKRSSSRPRAQNATGGA